MTKFQELKATIDKNWDEPYTQVPLSYEVPVVTDKLIKLKAAFTVNSVQAPGADCHCQNTITAEKTPNTEAYASSLGLILKSKTKGGKVVEILHSGPYSGILENKA